MKIDYVDVKGIIMKKTKNEFLSPLYHWDSNSSVRVKDRRLVNLDEKPKLPFSPGLVPIVDHKLVTEKDPHTLYELLGLRLFDYLRFTDYLETEAVVPATMLIARESLSFRYPEQMIFDGRRIATDEMYHAQCAEDLLQQMSKLTGLPTPPRIAPSFLAELKRTLGRVPKKEGPVALLFFCIVSETLVTSILKELPKDESVMDIVRDVVADHNEDEARHSLYFSQVLEVIWEQMPMRQKDIVGPLIPEFVKMFLEPDRTVLERCLHEVGFNSREIDQIWQETYPKASVLSEIRQAAAPSLRRFDGVGVFDHNATHEAFERHGLKGLS